jgi:hypothetical protein
VSGCLRGRGGRLAHYWQRLLAEGKYRTITEIDAIEGSTGVGPVGSHN